MKQLDKLMKDLTELDRFFTSNEYYRWDREVESLRSGLEKCFQIIEKRPFAPLSPILIFKSILSYGEHPERGHGDKRFFVNLEMWGCLNAYGYQYHINVKAFHKYLNVPHQGVSNWYFIKPQYGKGSMVKTLIDGLKKEI